MLVFLNKGLRFKVQHQTFIFEKKYLLKTKPKKFGARRSRTEIFIFSSSIETLKSRNNLERKFETKKISVVIKKITVCSHLRIFHLFWTLDLNLKFNAILNTTS